MTQNKSLTNTWPTYSEDEIQAVMDVLRSGRVNQWTGDRVRTFQEAFANYCQAPHAVGVANGTVALEIALLALGISKGDEVIVTSRSFVASASCVVSVGATPVFADVDNDSQNISVNTITPLVTSRTKAIVPVHLAGWPCDMPEIMSLAAAHDLAVIEDCAQAVGAKILDRPVGSFGHAAAFSFCQDKIMTTGGEGGMILFQDQAAAEWAMSYKDHGKNISCFTDRPKGNVFPYVHDAPGTNLRLTEMQAAIGIIQLSKLDQWIGLRQRNAQIWKDALRSLPCIEIPEPAEHIQHAYYKFYAFLKEDFLKPGSDRSQILDALSAEDIRAFSGSCPEIYREKLFSDTKTPTRPTAHALGISSLMFEIHPTLDEVLLKKTATRTAQIIADHQSG